MHKSLQLLSIFSAMVIVILAGSLLSAPENNRGLRASRASAFSFSETDSASRQLQNDDDHYDDKYYPGNEDEDDYEFKIHYTMNDEEDYVGDDDADDEFFDDDENDDDENDDDVVDDT